MYKKFEMIFSLSQLRKGLILLVFVTIILAIYHHILNAPFLLDDFLLINNPTLHISSNNFSLNFDYLLFSPAVKRRLSLLSFSVNFSQGGQPFPFHLTNIIIHLLNGLLLLYFCFSLLKLNGARQPLLVSFLGTLVWLVHPVNTSAVTYITQRYTSLCSLFFLCTLICYLQARSHQRLMLNLWSALCALSMLLALASKEIAATLPFIILLLEFLILRKSYDFSQLFWGTIVSLVVFAGISCVYLLSPGLSWYQNPDYKIWAKLLLPCYYMLLLLYICWFTHPLRNLPDKKIAIVLAFVILAIFLIFAHSIFAFVDTWAQSYHLKGFSPHERMLTELRVVAYYLSLIFYPALRRLRLDYDVSLSTSLFSPITTLFSLLLIIAVFAFIASLLQKRKLMAFSLLWLFGNLVIESTFVPLDIAYEYRIYLPSMLFLSLGIGALLAIAFRKNSKKWKVGAILCYLAVMMTLMVTTYRRNSVWRSPITLWEDNAQKSPEKPRVWASLGQSYLSKALKTKDAAQKQQLFVQAKRIFHKTLAMTSKKRNSLAVTVNTCNNLGLTYFYLGELDEAKKQFKRALAMDIHCAKANLNLALIYMHRNRLMRAMERLKMSRAEEPTALGLFYALCLWHCRTNDFQAAFQEIEQGLKLYPGNLNLEQMRASTLEKRQRAKQAQKSSNAGVRLFKQALAQRDSQRRNNMLLQARKKLEQALRLYPDLPNVCTDLATIYYNNGEYKKALHVLKIRIAGAYDSIDKQDFLPLYLTGLANWKLSIYFDARQALLRAVEIDEKNAMAQAVLGLASWGHGKYKQGKTELEKAVLLGLSRCPDIDPKFPEAYEYLATLYLKRNQAKRAIVVLEALLRQNPDRQQAKWYIGIAHLQNKQAQKAVESFKGLLSHSTGTNRAKILVNLGDAYAHLPKEKGSEKAKKSLMQAIELDPSLSLAYLKLASVYQRVGDHSKALEVLYRGLQAAVNFRLYYALGVIQFEQKQFGKALVNFQKSVALQKNYLPSLAALGILHWLSGDFKYGESLMGKAVAGQLELQILPKIGAESAEAFNCLASQLIKQNHVEDAITMLQEIRCVRPELAEVQFNLGVAFLRQKKQRQAAIYFGECLKLKPGDSQALYNLACAYLNGKNYGKATEILQQAIIFHPRNADFHSLWGVICFQQGDFANASIHLRQALSLDPNNTMARKYLAKMAAK